MEEIKLPAVLEFDWDKYNKTKSWTRHRVSVREQEEAFFDKEKRVFEDVKHSKDEKRFILFSKTRKKRKLVIVFTIRSEKIRCISARTMSRREVPIYEKAT